MTETKTVPEDVAILMEGIGYTGQVAYSCHQVSLAIVRSGLYPGARVARGWADGVIGQHSWVAVDGDPYDPNGRIIDATLWSYDNRVTKVWAGHLRDGRHHPHGAGVFLTAGMPENHGGRVIRLIINRPLSPAARHFLDMLGPLDYRGWGQVAHLPVRGWPAKEIIEAILDTPEVAILVPIDIAGMLTDRNPKGLYF